MTYDFSCWVLKYNGASIFNKVYRKSSIKITDGQKIPLLWNHRHNDPTNVLGYAILEDRGDGIYAYCTLHNNSNKKNVIKLIQDRGSVSISPCVNQIKYDKNLIVDGIIREVSLVLERIDPDEAYYPVLNDELIANKED